MVVDIEKLSKLLLKARENSLAYIKPVLNEHELTEQQWRVIRELHKNESLSAQRLADESGILSPSLSRILAFLTEDGVIIRKADKADQRAQTIRLSAKGKRLHNRVQPKVEKQYKNLVKDMGADTLSRLNGALEKLADPA